MFFLLLCCVLPKEQQGSLAFRHRILPLTASLGFTCGGRNLGHFFANLFSGMAPLTECYTMHLFPFATPCDSSLEHHDHHNPIASSPITLLWPAHRKESTHWVPPWNLIKIAISMEFPWKIIIADQRNFQTSFNCYCSCLIPFSVEIKDYILKKEALVELFWLCGCL